jgi:hypothetical protein
VSDFTIYRDAPKFILDAETDTAQRWFDGNTIDDPALNAKSIGSISDTSKR